MQPETGLTTAEVEARRAAGQINRPPESPTKTVAAIVRDNVFTYFNLVFVVLAVMLALVGSYANMTFLGVVVCNTVIGIVQHLRAKRTVDQLTLVSAHRVRCLRDGVWGEQLSEELVQGDVVEFSAGDQICADAVVLTGEAQANEALITGEAQAVRKGPGAALRSGSFLMSGNCMARLTQVGAESYASRLTTAAKADGHRVTKGEMMRSLDALIRFIGIALVPLGIVLFFKQYRTLAMPLRDSVESTVAALIGMIPEGLYLLTSVALAVSMMRLARRKVLAQDMNCIETLARVDVLCVDKTGTITEAAMQADDPVPLPGADEAALETILCNFYAGTRPDNATACALCERFGNKNAQWRRTGQIPFHSAYKYSAAAFAEQGAFFVGAPEFLAGSRYSELKEYVEPFLQDGRRVLLLAHGRALPARPEALDPETLDFLALLPLHNRIRASAPETFRYFAQQGVAVKVISGDHPRAVSRVAAGAGIAGAETFVDASALPNDEALAEAAVRCTVFGRVTPEQKRKLVQALQSQGHTVAMTGDGVNDVLALKEAECGIAMASGAQAASQVAQLVLLDSDFAALPHVVAEGRRVINNIQHSAALYLVKNIFSFSFSFAALFLTMSYPLQPLQLTLISAVTIGIPSFFLALEPNRDRVRGHFLLNVLRAAAPGGLTDLVLVLLAQGFAAAFGLSYQELSTITTVLLLAVGLAVLWGLCRPFHWMHRVLWGSMAALAVLGLVLLAPVLELCVPSAGGCMVLLVLLALVVQTLALFTRMMDALNRAAGRMREKIS
ncbi:MAG: HAD-IC family P-type ATPase [Gemmiger sp.]